MSRSEKIQSVFLLSALALALALLLTVGRERQQSATEAHLIASNHMVVTARRIPAEAQVEDTIDGITVTATRQRVAQVSGIGQPAK